MANFNKVILVGNLTRDPEVRYLASGTAVTSFGLAVNRRYKVGEENKEETLFIDIVVFGKSAETANEYLKKGKPVLIEGRLSYRKWEDKSGQTKTKHEVVAETFQFLGGRSESEGGPRRDGEGGMRHGGDVPTVTEDDIPF